MLQKIIILLIGFSFCYVTDVNSQGMPSSGSSSSPDLEEKRISFVPVPYLNYSRTLGFTFGAIPMAMYKVNPNDTVSPASITGLLGMFTTNDSWYTMFFQRLYLKEDDWRVTAAGGTGSVNFKFYLDAPISGFINYNTQSDFLFFEVQRRLYKDLYVGINYIYTKFNTQFELDEVPEFEPTTLHGLGFKLAYDHRDDVYYPRNGMLSEADFTTYPEFLKNSFISNKIEIKHNQYFSMRNDKDVIAGRLYGGFGVGDLSFEQQFIVGRQDIRGYTQGKYRGDQLLALQGEYRWNFHQKISAVGFAGIATVSGSNNEEDNGIFLPGVGTGIRYNIVPKYHMNAGIDVAVGKDDWGVYFKIGEAF